MPYNDVKDLIKGLINGISVGQFNGDLLEQFAAEYPNFWEEFVTFLYSERGQDYLEHTPIYQNDFSNNSVFSFIARYCDLNNTNIYDTLKEKFLEYGIDLSTQSGLSGNSGNYFWNETVSHALATYLNYFDDEIQGPILGNYVTITDVKNADAGRTFHGQPWVRPEHNIDDEKYKDVRGNDKIVSVLNNSDQLQFTNEQENNRWIRLLMPKYLRKVEVEDLNRNFWVIGQVVGAICKFLFDEDAPFKDLFKSIIEELVQLWENVLYLWATIATITQKPTITNIHTEIIPISNNEWMNYIKFDNFRDPTREYLTKEVEGFEEYVDYIIHQYSDSNICLIPVVRDENYKHNYYAIEYYPGIIFYDRNTGIQNYLSFIDNNTNKSQIFIDTKEGSTKKVSEGGYADIAGALKENDITYNYVYPVEQLETRYFDQPYYLLLRTIPSIEVSYDTQNGNGIVVTNFEIDVHDVSSELKYGREIIIQKFIKDLNEDWNSQNPTAGTIKEEHLGDTLQVQPPLEDVPLAEEFVIQKGYYAGEFPSYCYPLLAPSYDMDTVAVGLIPFILPYAEVQEVLDTNTQISRETKIRDYLEARITNQSSSEYQDRETLISQEQQDTEYAINNDMNIVSTYLRENDISTRESKKFRLCFGLHTANLYNYDENWQTPPPGWQIKLYDPVNGTIQNSTLQDQSNLKDHYQASSDVVHLAASIFNPATKQTIDYRDYRLSSYSASKWISNSNSTYGFATVYLKNSSEIMTTTNWLLRYTVISYTDNLSSNISIESKYQRNGEANGKVNYRITTHIFGPPATPNDEPFYACKVYDRYDGIPQNIPADGAPSPFIPPHLDQWKVTYINKSNFESFENLRNGNTLYVFKTTAEDYELYPNTGFADKEEVESTFIDEISGE